jgi:4-hydroxy-tetrahydrodipicolinate synthase
VTCTPFDADGEVDEAALRRHLRWMLDEGGVHGIIPTGSTGEFAFLTEAERQRVVAVTLEEARGRAPVIAGAAACSTRETIRYAQYAEKAGADGVMVVSPYYGHLSQEELYRHFRAVAESIAIPVMLYNNPGTSGSDIQAETVARLADVKNVVAIKESTGQMQRVNEIMRLCGDRVAVLCGCDTLPLEMFLMGVEGWVAAPANAIPRECVALWDLAVVQQDLAAARVLYDVLLPLFELFEGSGQYVQLNKAALERLGRPIGRPRLPLLPASDERQAELAAIMDRIAAYAGDGTRMNAAVRR